MSQLAAPLPLRSRLWPKKQRDAHKRGALPGANVPLMLLHHPYDFNINHTQTNATETTGDYHSAKVRDKAGMAQLFWTSLDPGCTPALICFACCDEPR